MERRWRLCTPIVVMLAVIYSTTGYVGAAEAGAAWAPDELNWYGISQRRVNDTRVDAGLAVLGADSYLWGLAHERARDMAERNYLSHTTPEGLDAGAYMRKDGVRYERWTELRADDPSGEPDVDIAWRVVGAFLNQPTAREAITGDFDRLGVAMAGSPTRRVFVIMMAKTVPAPPPAAPVVASVPAPAPASIADIIKAAANRHGVDSTRLLRVARCESGLNPRAYNAAGPYIGLFQFHPSTFRSFGGRDIYDPYDQADVAARMFARGLGYHWGCR